jgi:hypothetical protein
MKTRSKLSRSLITIAIVIITLVISVQIDISRINHHQQDIFVTITLIVAIVLTVLVWRRPKLTFNKCMTIISVCVGGIITSLVPYNDITTGRVIAVILVNTIFLTIAIMFWKDLWK